MIQDIFVEFENNSRVLDYRYQYKDILIWPYVRDVLLRKVILSGFGLLPNVERRGKVKKCRDYFKYNTLNLPKRDILYFSPASAYVESGNQFFDRLIDDFVELKTEVSSKIIQYNQELDFSKLERMKTPFSLDVFINKIIAYEGSKQKISDIDLVTINNFIEYLKQNIPFDVEEGIYEAVKKQAIVVARFFPSYYKYYKELLDIVQPKLIILHCGVYGLPEVKVFNDYGVVTAEYQHGSIDHHWDYMYGKSVAESAVYREHMPRYLLTWGEYWTRGMNIPADVIQIGNPVVHKNIKDFLESSTDINDMNCILLVVGDGFEWYVEFLAYLLDNLQKDYQIMVKLHPLHPEDRRYFEGFLDSGRVSIIWNDSIYDCFMKCKHIVGGMSTALYEAAAIGRDVYIIDNELTGAYMHGEFGTLIKNGKDFIEKMRKEKEKKFSCEDFFVSNWKDNYLKFVQSVLDGSEVKR